MAKKKENKPPTLNERIENAVNLGPLTPLYFVVAIDMLKNHIDSSEDESIEQLFERLFSADRVRSNIKEIHKVINNLPNEQTTT
ncbi:MULTISPECIES: hypothetical protein [Bacteroides]|jgi:hypothetical protein|uniref:Uncharacterized protein n=1 Tax=Bacteroides graminisolvens DSM 19988 = JCM 15093 TaxID=1121097 RepID=A0A069D616_9BACE|nr:MULTISPECIES: hypothetical protein [Bacteroides]GAK37790.1 hypothetical protein JCM15093_3069 [Bacteroides graminisolvens DSM 19988 = JCM 15093]DAX32129.1 MAG TPA: hypothetical protein [Caudoviricetes sp.]